MMLQTPEISHELENRISNFRGRVLNDPVGVLDPPDQHHQFASLVNHGRKLDFDKIETGSNLFWNWVSVYADWIKESRDDRQIDALIGVANGANRLATTMAASVGAVGLETIKLDPKTVGLSQVARFAIQMNQPQSVVIIEDVGTTGGTTSTVIPELRELGVHDIEVAHTWIRNPQLPALDKLTVPYGAVILEPLPTFSAEDCLNLTEGFCHNGIQLIPHGQ